VSADKGVQFERGLTWPRWRIRVQVKLVGQPSMFLGSWELKAASVNSAMKRGPELAVAELKERGIKGRSKIEEMTVAVSQVASMGQASQQAGN